LTLYVLGLTPSVASLLNTSPHLLFQVCFPKMISIKQR
jgi:hypothetical protein